MENPEQILNTNYNQESHTDLIEIHNILGNIQPQTPEQFETKKILERAKNILTRSH